MASSTVESPILPNQNGESQVQQLRSRRSLHSFSSSHTPLPASANTSRMGMPMTPPPQTPAPVSMPDTLSFFDLPPPVATPRSFQDQQSSDDERYMKPRTSTSSFSSTSSISSSTSSFGPASSSLNMLTPTSSASSISSLHKSASPRVALAVNPDIEAILPICAQELGVMIASKSSKILLVDVRPYAQYSSERIRGAVNLCVPSTLLKRPASTVAKILDSLAVAQKRDLSGWASSEFVIVYDSSSTMLTPSSIAFQTARKFLYDDSYKGRVYFVKGGVCDFAQRLPDFIEYGDLATLTESTGSCWKSSESKCLPILSGLHLPIFSRKQPVNPFFSNIRQNMDLIGGVGDPIPVRIPAGCKEEKLKALPRWLQDVVCGCDGAQHVADRFLEIEKAEKGRLESAFSSSCVISSSIANAFSCKSEEPKFSISAALERGTKNRYNNIFPYDHTRVKLSCAPGSCDYINASFISARHSRKRYIATQGPLPETFTDFWSVVWDQNVRVIVMLTPTQEGDQVKCHSYWKDTRYGPLNLVMLSEQETELSPKTGTIVRIRKFSLSHTAQPFSPMREITHIQYVSWPDLGTPADPVDLVALSKLSGKYNYSENEARPVVVHCSAGCGRTGTFCTVDSVIDIMKTKKEYDNCVSCPTEDLVAEVVHDLRTQRLSMVQCLRQFVICYESVLEWKIEELEKEEALGSHAETAPKEDTEKLDGDH